MASPSRDEHEDEDEEFQNESEGSYESDEDASSVSSFSESDMPNGSFAPMPARLTLPAELHRTVLALETRGYHEMWGTYRFVSKAWKESVEFLAKTEWIKDARFVYPGETIWDPKVGKVFLEGEFTFQRFDGEIAVFQMLDCAEEFKRPLIRLCKLTAFPDVQVGDIVHDVEITGMSVDWDTLTITCPWRELIGRLMAEELRVAAHRKRAAHEMMSAAKRARRAAPDGEVDMGTIMELFGMFAGKTTDAYVAVRTARHGVGDRQGDERLKMARQAAAMRDFFSTE
ncbi:hypothetical protein C8R47DRAFT_1074290 [Mycena vitilis]|nr:hypothetical protein C8R47DRAFT_1074290 [Mycena vitilis]